MFYFTFLQLWKIVGHRYIYATDFTNLRLGVYVLHDVSLMETARIGATVRKKKSLIVDVLHMSPSVSLRMSASWEFTALFVSPVNKKRNKEENVLTPSFINRKVQLNNSQIEVALFL